MSSASIVIRDPGGSRSEPLPFALQDDIHITHHAGQWWLRATGPAVRLNGRPQSGDAQLHSGDVIGIGATQWVLRSDGQAPRIDVFALHGNQTIAPLETAELPGDEVGAGMREIRVADEATADAGGRGPPRLMRTRPLGMAALLVFAALLLTGLARVVSLPLDITPVDARVDIDGVHWRWGQQLLAMRGSRNLEVQAPGYRSERRQIEVNGDLAAQPLRIALMPLPGTLRIDTHGQQAQVLIDGMDAGSAPGTVELEAGSRHVLLRAPRHLDFQVDVEVEGQGREQSLVAALAPDWGWLEVDSKPAGAQVLVDGRELGRAPQKLELDSGLHQLELRASGRMRWRSQVAITAGQTLDLGAVDLAQTAPAVAAAVSSAATNAPGEAAPPPKPAAPAAPPPPRIQSALLGTLIWVPAGSFQQGSDRREQGRRSNETQRSVTISRPFYMAEKEVTNAQFRVFRSTHASGIAIDRTLDLDNFAVSSVTWDDAVAFCNWLSQREDLPLAYERRAGRWQLVEPLTAGYRLPTEAEWEYAGRYVDGRSTRRYSWGDALPPPAGAENLAGGEVNAGVRPERAQKVLPGYSDEHAVVAPVGSYGRNALGIADMGGNVSEWMHDAYASLLPSEPVTDPRGDASAGPHVIRGANWQSSSMAELRLAWRDRSAGAQQTLGFRVVRGVKETP